MESSKSEIYLSTSFFSSQSTGKTFYGAGELGIGLFSPSHSFVVVVVVLGLRCCRQAFSSCGVNASRLEKNSGSRAQTQYLRGSGLVAPWHVESSWTRDQTHVPCFGRQILNR